MKILFILISLFSLSAQAGDIRGLVEQLRDSGEDYEIVGVICEQAARLDLAREYPSPRYEVKTGIAYGTQHRTVGELDVIVFDADRSAVLVGEVKCWRNLNGARKKAANQRQRFLDAMASGKPYLFFKKHDGSYEHKQFAEVKDFISIAQGGAKEAGFTRELDFSLEELMQARKELLTCQSSGACKRAMR